MDLREAQAQVHAYISQFKEGYFPPLVNLARLTEEVGELARALVGRVRLPGLKSPVPGALARTAGEQRSR